MLTATRHDTLCREDYKLIKSMGIHTVREGLSWSEIDKGGGVYRFDRFEKMMKIAKEESIQQIWDLNHFDYPEYLDPFTESFVIKFAEYARRAIKIIKKYQKAPIYIAPINEISFFAWIAADRGSWAPFKRGSTNGLIFKKQLVRAVISAMDAIWHEDSRVRFIHIDPFMRRLELEPANLKAMRHVQKFNDVVRFEAWDMIAGKKYPELGGDPKYLDIIGMNYYFHNQEFVISKGSKGISHMAMEWDSKYRVPFWKMIGDVWDRYKRPIVISETGSFGDLRSSWWERTLKEISIGIKKGLPISGVCSYPTVDRPNHVNYLERYSGMWDFLDDDIECRRVPHEKTIGVIRKFIKSEQRAYPREQSNYHNLEQ